MPVILRIVFAFFVCGVFSGFSKTVFRRSMDRVASMDPAMASSLYAGRAVQMVYEPLYEFDYRARPYRLIPCLAESIPEILEGGRVYILRLSDDARFHDDPCFAGGRGRSVRADDVIYSLLRLGDRRLASPGAWLVESSILGMKAYAEASAKISAVDSLPVVPGLRALDARTVRIELTRPMHQFLWYLAMSYTSIVAREAVEKYGEEFGAHAVGTGPYTLASWRRNHQMRFSRDPRWRGWLNASASTPSSRFFDVVEYNVIDDVSTQWLCFLNGELDFLGEISRDNWDVVIDGSGGLSDALRARGVSLFSIPTLEVAYVGINMEDPVLGPNKALRQALNCAFDAPAWICFLNGRVTACDGPVPPATEGKWNGPFPYSFNLEKAKQLLVRAGYPGGVDPKTGRRLELTIDLGRTSQDIRESTELMVSFYARVGLSLRPQYHNWPSFLQRISERRSSLFRIGWVGDYPDAENFLQLFYGKNVSPGPNRVNYVNPAFDRLYEQACAETDAKKRNALWREAQQIICEDCPWIFLNFPKAYSLTGPHVQNYIPSDFPFGTEKYLHYLP